MLIMLIMSKVQKQMKYFLSNVRLFLRIKEKVLTNFKSRFFRMKKITEVTGEKLVGKNPILNERIFSK